MLFWGFWSVCAGLWFMGLSVPAHGDNGVGYMADFKDALSYALSHEGGYSNDPRDSGGETILGISRKNWPDLDLWRIVDKLKTEMPFDGRRLAEHITKRINDNALAMDMIEAFYRENFWRYDNIVSQAVANKVFDYAVNMGPRNATMVLQRALRACGIPIGDDGILGPETIKAANAADPQMLLVGLRSEAAGYYRKIGKSAFINGWLNRAYA